MTGHVRVLLNGCLRMARMAVEFHLLRPYLTTPEKEQLLRGEGIQVLIYGKTGERFPVTLQHIDDPSSIEDGLTLPEEMGYEKETILLPSGVLRSIIPLLRNFDLQ